MLGIGLYGDNGHQIQNLLINHPKAELIAISNFRAKCPVPGITEYAGLDDMLKDDRIKLISLCSPMRSDQAKDAVKCMQAGKHVYAEKPCALTEGDLDMIIMTAKETGMSFHEMADTTFMEPYISMREIVKSGSLGEIIQVFAQKSYPYHDRRPQDEITDGGLTRQAGIHAIRFIEHVTGIKIKEISCFETSLGNPVSGGGLKMASSIMMKLSNGGVASAVVNYLNQPGFPTWGNENLRIFGLKGFVEATDGGTKTRLVIGDKDHGPIKTRENIKPFFDMLVDSLISGGEMPLSMEDELHPTRMVIRANAIYP